MNDAGRIGFVIKGNYDNTVMYDFLDVVFFGDSSYVAKKLTIGNEPQDSDEYWQVIAKTPLNGVIGVKGNAETIYRKGNVNLTAENIGAITKIRLTNQNLDEITEANFYYAAGNNSVTGKPPGMLSSLRFGLCVANVSPEWRLQILFGGDRKIYTRWYDGKAWNSWKLEEPVITSSRKNLTVSSTGAWYRLGYVSQKSSFYGEFVLTHTWYNSLPCVSKFIVAVASGGGDGAVKAKEIFFNDIYETPSLKTIKKIRVIYPDVAANDMNIYIDAFLGHPSGSYLDTWFYTLDDSLETIEWVDSGFEKNPEVPEGGGNHSYISKEFSFTD